jgi:hypothetical protein
MDLQKLNIIRSLKIFILSVALPGSLLGQEIKKTLNSSSVDVINLNQNGFILAGGDDLFCYSEKGELQWAGKRANKISIVASPTGSYVYDLPFLEIDHIISGAVAYKKNLSITQFDSKGFRKQYEINPAQGLGKNLQSVYCNDNYLFALSTENGDETNDKKKGAEKLILHRYKNADFSYQKFTVGVPALSSGENTTYWSLLGQAQEGTYLLAKEINPKENKVRFRVALINDDGKVINILSIDPSLGDRYFRPAIVDQSPDVNDKAFIVTNNLEYFWDLGVNPVSAKPRSNGFFSHLLYDQVSNYFYAYGLFGTKPNVYEGFYIFKFDTKGNKVWELVEMGSKQLLGESHFKSFGTDARRNVKLTVLPNEILNLSISFRDTRYFYEIANGKVSGTDRLQGFPAYDNSKAYYFTTSPPLKSQEHIKSQKQFENRSQRPHQLVNSSIEVLIIESKKTSEIRTFKR